MSVEITHLKQKNKNVLKNKIQELGDIIKHFNIYIIEIP